MEVFDVCCADPLQPPLCLPRKNNYFEISDSAVVYPKYSQIFQMTHRTYGTNNALKHLIMKYENLGYNIPLAKPQYPPPPPSSGHRAKQTDQSSRHSMGSRQRGQEWLSWLPCMLDPQEGFGTLKALLKKINKLKQKEPRIVRAKGWTATQPHDARHPTSQSVSPLKLSQYNRNVILVKNWMLAEV